MVLQAGGAQRVLRTDPDRAGLALGDIESQGRNAMGELRHMLNLLRTSEQSPCAAQPTHSPRWTASSTGCGAPGSVTCEERGRRPDLPESLDLTAYRVVQEGLTNVTEHVGPGAHATVRLVWTDACLCLEVEDDGAGTPSTRPGELSTGHGLTGLCERVEVFGGTMKAGPTAGGYRVSVTLPIPWAAGVRPTVQGAQP
jgi:signal transduction histidine kinase